VTTRDTPAVVDYKARHWSIFASVREALMEYYCNVWCRKTRMVWLSDCEKVWGYDYSFWYNIRTWQTARQTDTQTPQYGV